jgi:hypothetical protein
MPNITIHGKRVETIYAFTIQHGRQSIDGQYIAVDGEDEDELLGLPEEREKIEYRFYTDIHIHNDVKNAEEMVISNLKQAIEDYEKTR